MRQKIQRRRDGKFFNELFVRVTTSFESTLWIDEIDEGKIHNNKTKFNGNSKLVEKKEVEWMVLLIEIFLSFVLDSLNMNHTQRNRERDLWDKSRSQCKVNYSHQLPLTSFNLLFCLVALKITHFYILFFFRCCNLILRFMLFFSARCALTHSSHLAMTSLLVRCVLRIEFIHSFFIFCLFYSFSIILYAMCTSETDCKKILYFFLLFASLEASS